MLVKITTSFTGQHVAINADKIDCVVSVGDSSCVIHMESGRTYEVDANIDYLIDILQPAPLLATIECTNDPK